MMCNRAFLCTVWSTASQLNKHAYSSSIVTKSVFTPTASGKKKTVSPKINLLTTDEKFNVITLEEAQKLAARRSMKLIKVEGNNSNALRPVYKLLAAKEIHSTKDVKPTQKNSTYKGEKVLLINTRIEQNDLKLRVNNLQKWLTKGYKVRIAISDDARNAANGDKIFSTIETSIIGCGKISQKRSSSADIKFEIVPNTKNEERNHSSVDGSGT